MVLLAGSTPTRWWFLEQRWREGSGAWSDIFQMTTASNEGFFAQLWEVKTHLEKVTWRPPSFPGSRRLSFVTNAWHGLGLVTFPWWEDGVGIDGRGPSGSEIQIPVPKAVSLFPSPGLPSWRYDTSGRK